MLIVSHSLVTIQFTILETFQVFPLFLSSCGRALFQFCLYVELYFPCWCSTTTGLYLQQISVAKQCKAMDVIRRNESQHLFIKIIFPLYKIPWRTII